MENSIGIGVLIVLTLSSTAFILSSDYFTKSQKVILGILFMFPPGQWVLALILGIWNSSNNKTQGFKTNKINSQIDDLKHLKNKGILTEEEYYIKESVIIEKQELEKINKSAEYKLLEQLKKDNILTETEFKTKTELLKLNFSQRGGNEIIEQDDIFQIDSSFIMVVFIIVILIAVVIIFNV